MSSMGRKIRSFLAAEDKAAILRDRWLRFRHRYIYARKLGAFGKGSILRRPIRVLGRKHIFIGERVDIMDGLRIEAVRYWNGKEYTPRIEIGDTVTIGQNCHFTAANRVVIGEGVSILPDVLITDIEHEYVKDRRISETGLSVGSVSIGAHTVIGMGARILGSKSVSIGKNVTIGANAVVTESFPDNVVIAGIPARIIKTYDYDE